MRPVSRRDPTSQHPLAPDHRAVLRRCATPRGVAPRQPCPPVVRFRHGQRRRCDRRVDAAAAVVRGQGARARAPPHRRVRPAHGRGGRARPHPARDGRRVRTARSSTRCRSSSGPSGSIRPRHPTTSSGGCPTADSSTTGRTTAHTPTPCSPSSWARVAPPPRARMPRAGTPAARLAAGGGDGARAGAHRGIRSTAPERPGDRARRRAVEHVDHLPPGGVGAGDLQGVPAAARRRQPGCHAADGARGIRLTARAGERRRRATASGTTSASPPARARGHLAFAQEFLPGVEDAWRVALTRRPPTPRSPTRPARSAPRWPRCTSRSASCSPASSRRRSSSIASPPRGAAASASPWPRCPSSAAHRAAIDAVYDRAQAGAWPELQRIHGDLHLGQVLLVPGRGWVLLDFEGEPLRPDARPAAPRPARARRRRHAALVRLRGRVDRDRPARAHRRRRCAWADAARHAFIDGYVAASGLDLSAYRDLLAAFELDKAVYEAIYEARNRPTWAAIPLHAIMSLLESGRGCRGARPAGRARPSRGTRPARGV